MWNTVFPELWSTSESTCKFLVSHLWRTVSRLASSTSRIIEDGAGRYCRSSGSSSLLCWPEENARRPQRGRFGYGSSGILATPEARSRPSHKLQLKWYGPFKVLQRVGPNAYRLELPHTVRCHPVLNVSALKKYHQNSIAGRVQSPPPPITNLDGHERFVVDSVLDHWVCRGQLQFLVRWRGYHKTRGSQPIIFWMSQEKI